MKIDHAAIYYEDIEKGKAFFETYFGAKSNAMYHNPRTGFSSYFLSFEDGSRLEVMHKDGLESKPKEDWYGLIHLAFNAGSQEKVDALTRQMVEDGCQWVSGPRWTGDGYYESCVKDPEGNLIEITV